MRWVFWILGLFALAVGVALAVRFNTGYALLVWPPYRVELSLNLLLLLLVIGFAAIYLVLRFVFAATELPQRVREFRGRRRQERARKSMLDALHAFFEGRYGRAEKSAAGAIDDGEMPVLGAVLAAQAAHELRRYEQRDGYLARAERLAPAGAAMRIISHAGMLLDERRFQDALTALKSLPEKHTAALRAGMGTFALPFKLPSIMVSMLWHPRMHADPVHAWLRECVRKTAAAPNRRS